jgi:HSP20 family protein
MSTLRHTNWLGSNGQDARRFGGGFQDEIKQVFDRFLADSDSDQSNVVTSQWAPRVDIREEAERFVILADVPGVDPKNIEVNMDKGILSIRGERKSDAKEAAERYSRVERSHGLFYRRFALPDSAHAEGITASGSHGVLEIAIPKKPETQPRRISVNAG